MNSSGNNDALDASPLGLIAVLVLFFGGLFLLPISVPLCGATFTLAGLVMGASLRKANLAECKPQLAMCVVLTVLLGLVTYFVFTLPASLLTLLGAVFAFSFGQLLGMLVRTVVNCTRG
jgi:hypothetical protein